MACRRITVSCLADFFEWVCRLWGIITAIGLWGLGVETVYFGHLLGFYLIAAAAVMSFFEAVYFLNYLVDAFHKSCRCWDLMLWLDNWKKGVLYILLSAGCFVDFHRMWMGIIAGVMVVLSGVFYILKTFKVLRDRRIAKELAEHETYDRFDEVQYEIEDNIGSVTNPGSRLGFNTHSEDGYESVADQDDMLDV